MAPQFSKKDRGEYLGFILGTAAMFTLLGTFGIHAYWPKLIGSVLVGMGCGYAGGQFMVRPSS